MRARIAELEQQLEALQAQSAAELRFIQESCLRAQAIAGVGSWEWDVARNETRWSDELYQILGLAPQSTLMTYEDFLKFVHPQDINRVLSAVSAALREGGSYDVQHRICRPDGQERTLRSQGMVFRDDQGGHTRLTGVSQDVTERCQLEEGLVQAQRMEAVGQLTSGIAHEFNNIFFLLQGHLDLLEAQATLEAGSRRRVAAGKQAIQRGAALAERLLAYARHQDLETSRVDLNQLLFDMVRMLEGPLGDRMHLELQTDEPLPPLHINVGMLETCVLNLALNAWDAMPAGGTLTFGTGTEEVREGADGSLRAAPPGTYVRLRVSDTGEGMDEAVQQQVFQPFFTTKNRDQHSGLGLNSVNAFVKNCGGWVEVNSVPRHGTAFTIYLPSVRMLEAI